MNSSKSEAAIEALLFAAGDLISVSRLAECIGEDVKLTQKLLNKLIDKYSQRGINILKIGDAYQMSSNPVFFEHIQKLALTHRRKKLSSTLLETLAIVAYKQPVTKSQIEQIRGVNAEHAVNKLLEYGLIVEKGRQDAPGRAILFGTSIEFLRYFGLDSLSSLPVLSCDYDRLRQEAENEYPLNL